MNGQTLIALGYKPGPWFKSALEAATKLEANGVSEETILSIIAKYEPAEVVRVNMRPDDLSVASYASPEGADEVSNINSALTHLKALTRAPTVVSAALMPDACPTGSLLGSIPVGGVAACDNAIHPDFHSADVCCSVAMTILDRDINPSLILDMAQKITRFGPGGRKDNDAINNTKLMKLIDGFGDNKFLKDLEVLAITHFMTQGDGNHFFFVGDLEGRTVMITHHGSRGFGAGIYKRGKQAAIQNTRAIAAGVPDHMAWITADSDDGLDYWAALQVARKWTKLNHFAIHDAVLEQLGAKSSHRMWNEHNFVFQKSDGLFYHAKGATPAFKDFSEDDQGLTLIPLNMGAGVLVADHSHFQGPKEAMGFCPHGAGRNYSRSQHMRNLAETHGELTPSVMMEIFKSETFYRGIDARFWTGKFDLSELPSAYKSASKIMQEIKDWKLAEIAHEVTPYGSIMAGETYQPWRKK